MFNHAMATKIALPELSEADAARWSPPFSLQNTSLSSALPFINVQAQSKLDKKLFAVWLPTYNLEQGLPRRSYIDSILHEKYNILRLIIYKSKYSK